MGLASGCGCKEVHRFHHTTYNPYSSCICSFLQQHPYFKIMFVFSLAIYNLCSLFLLHIMAVLPPFHGSSPFLTYISLCRWIYWTDREAKTLNRVSVLGNSQKTLLSNLTCLRPISVNFHNHTVYWTSSCMYSFQSIPIDGNGLPHSILLHVDHFFPYSIASFGNWLYWTESLAIYYLYSPGNSSNAMFGKLLDITRALSIQVVHPSNQLPGIYIVC